MNFDHPSLADRTPVDGPPTFDPFASPPVTEPRTEPAPRRRPQRHGRSVQRLASIVAVGAVAVAGGFVGSRLGGSDASGAVPVATTAPAVVPAAEVAFGDGLDVAEALAAVEQSVVSIDTVISVRRGPFAGSGEGAGTGVVMDSAGDIVTNAHVVAGATSITVTVPGDDTPRQATLVASDEAADIAVIHVDDTSGLVAAPLGTSGQLAVGDDVIAIGNALALEGGMTVTRGIVSALDRSIETESGTLGGLIQTDAAISSGNSGGALVNAAGEVVGINTAVAASYGGVNASNIGFAISIDTAIAVADALVERA